MRLQNFSLIQQIVLNTYRVWDTSLVPGSKISQNRNYQEIHSETRSSNRNFCIPSLSNKAAHSFLWLTKNISNNSFASDANSWAAGGEGACLTAKKPFISLPFPVSPPPARFLFFFKLQNLPQKKHGMIHPLVCSPRSSFSYWANPLTGSWIWTRQQRCWRCKREGFMTLPTSWKASTSLRRSLKTTCSGCEYGSPPLRPPVCWLWAGAGGGVLCKLQRGFSQPQLSQSCPHFFFSFFFSPTLFFSLLSSLLSSLAWSSKSLYKETFCLDGVIDKRIYIQSTSSKGILGLNGALQMYSNTLFNGPHDISMCAPM